MDAMLADDSIMIVNVNGRVVFIVNFMSDFHSDKLLMHVWIG
jgi:hypothetical protein